MEDDQFGSERDEVEVYHRFNRLKLKAGGDQHGGPGKLNKARLKSAHTIVENYAKKYPKEVKSILSKIEEAWKELNNEDLKIAKNGVPSLYHSANQLKDLSATCNSALMQHFGLSLRGFMEHFDLDKKEHKIIVKAHIDVIKAAYQSNMKDDDSDKAEQLKMILAKAIEKYG